MQVSLPSCIHNRNPRRCYNRCYFMLVRSSTGTLAFPLRSLRRHLGCACVLLDWIMLFIFILRYPAIRLARSSASHLRERITLRNREPHRPRIVVVGLAWALDRTDVLDELHPLFVHIGQNRQVLVQSSQLRAHTFPANLPLP